MTPNQQKIASRIDLRQPGAAEALDALTRNEASTDADYKLVADTYPVQIWDGFKPVSETEHHNALSKLRATIKSAARATVAVRSGAEVRSGSPAKISWGNANLNWISAGGAPRARMTEVKGPPSFGKSYAMLKLAAEVLAAFGKVLWVAIEPFDADWARTCGVPVHYPEEDAPPGSAQAAYNAEHPEGLGFDLIVGRTGNEVLQLVCNAIAINAWDAIIVDSISPAVSRTHLENKVVGDPSPGGEAGMVNQFCARSQTEWNGVESFVGRVVSKSVVCKSCGQVFSAKGDHDTCEQLSATAENQWKMAVAAEEKKAEEEGRKPRKIKPPTGAAKKPKFEESAVYGLPPRSALGVVNQLRAQGIGSSFPMAPDSAGGMGFHHGKSLAIMFSGRVMLKSDSGSYSEVYGSIVQVTADKSKVGIPNRTGVMEFWTRTVSGLSVAGCFNLMTDLIGAKLTFGDQEKVFEGLAQRAGIVKQSGGWFQIGEEKMNGVNALQKFLGQNPAIVQAIQAELNDWINRGAV